MSYDLDFWKYKTGTKLDNQNVYQTLSKGEFVNGLEELPIAEILEKINISFAANWKRVDSLTWESEKASFQIFTTTQFFRIDCYGMNGDDMNKFIEIAAEYKCPLYDPQIGERFDGS